MERKQDIAYQLELFFNGAGNAVHPSSDSEVVSGAEGAKVQQGGLAGEQRRALMHGLMEVVCAEENMQRAYKQVKRNKGVSGIDGMEVGEYAEWYTRNGDTLRHLLLSGSYMPQGVKTVEIPKPNGGVRRLGIPTVIDRVIQQAIAQVLSPIYERTFSGCSYGFRLGRSAQQAVRKASEYVSEGRRIVVDIDLKNFFDVVNHDRLMHRLSETIGDKVLLKVIRRYLQSGIMINGVMSQRTEGTPQGSPLSPLLSNIVLDELDKELERRGHHFVRYADDCNIFVRSQKAGERVLQSISNFIEGKLKLKVNTEKSKVCFSRETKFLGYTIQLDGTLTISWASIKRFKEKIRTLTRRNCGRSLEQIICELNPALRGWLTYYKEAKCATLVRNLDSWIRRKLRCIRLKQCKRVYSLQQFLERQGVRKWQSWIFALSGKGWWRKSGTPQAHEAMGTVWFNELGLYSLSLNYEALHH